MFRQLDGWLRCIGARWWQAAFWLLWCCATLVMVLPSSELPTVDMSDKTEHLLAFFALMVLVSLAYRDRVVLPVLAALLVAYGVAIECIQFFIPSRSFSVLDMVADAAGVLPAWWLANRLART